MIRCPQSKLELDQELPLPQGQEFTVRKITSLHKKDNDSSSHDHQEETRTAHGTCARGTDHLLLCSWKCSEYVYGFLEIFDYVSVWPISVPRFCPTVCKLELSPLHQGICVLLIKHNFLINK